MIKIDGFIEYDTNLIIPVRYQYECCTHDIMYNVVFIQLEINKNVHQIILN